MKHTTEPSRYRIVIRGRLGEYLASAFDSFEIESRAGESSLTGTFPDQAALCGLLDRLRDLCIPIVSVNPIDEREGHRAETAARHRDQPRGPGRLREGRLPSRTTTRKDGRHARHE